MIRPTKSKKAQERKAILAGSKVRQHTLMAEYNGGLGACNEYRMNEEGISCKKRNHELRIEYLQAGRTVMSGRRGNSEIYKIYVPESVFVY